MSGSSHITVTTHATAAWFRRLAAAGRTYLATEDATELANAARVTVVAGDGVPVAVMAARHITGIEPLYVPHDTPEPVRHILQPLDHGDFDGFEARLADAERTTPRLLMKALTVLGGNLARVDPDGTRGPLFLDTEDIGTPEPAQPRSAFAPAPRQLPEWRRKLVAHLQPDNAPGNAGLAAALQAGKFDIAPALPDTDDAARVLRHQEAARLAAARLYYVDADMCAVAGRKARRPRLTPLAEHRIPSPHGLLLFAEPVAFAPDQQPIAACSWGRWNPDDNPTPPGTGWLCQPHSGRISHLEPDPGDHIWWITMYTALPNRPTPLAWDREALITENAGWTEGAAEGTVAIVVRTLVACWDLITQERVATKVTETETLHRKPVKIRADRRRGITDDGTVRVITIRGRHAPAPRSSDDTTAPTTRQYRHRWPVTEHTRSHCMNPRGHADNECTHEDITIFDYIKGPAGAPLLHNDTVHALRSTK